MKLVIYPPIESQRLDRVTAAAGDMTVVNCATDEQARAEVADADAFFGKLTPGLLDAAEQLEWVQSPTASLEHYLFPELVQHPCTLTNMREIYGDVIADHVFGYVLCFARNLHVYLRQQQSRIYEPIGGEEERVAFATGPGQVTSIDRAHIHLADCTMGVVGLGGIGSEIVRRATSFGMKTLGVDPVAKDVPELSRQWDMSGLDQLLQQSDFVVIAAPHTPETEGLFDRARMQQMKSTGYLINIGRGVIVRLNDLCDALDAKEIAGAALDVFETEPLPAEHRLWGYDNVIITPHVAAYSPRIAERHTQVLLDNVAAFAKEQPLRNIVDKTKWY